MYEMFNIFRKKTSLIVYVSKDGLTIKIHSVKNCSEINLVNKPHLRSGSQKFRSLSPYGDFSGKFVLQFKDYLIEIRCFSTQNIKRNYQKTFYIKIWRSYSKKFAYYELVLVRKEAEALIKFFKEYWSECELT